MLPFQIWTGRSHTIPRIEQVSADELTFRIRKVLMVYDAVDLVTVLVSI